MLLTLLAKTEHLIVASNDLHSTLGKVERLIVTMTTDVSAGIHGDRNV